MWPALTWRVCPHLTHRSHPATPSHSHSWDCATCPWFCSLPRNVPSLGWSTSFSRFMKKWNYEVNILNFCRSEHIFILPTYLTDCLTGYITWGLDMIFLQDFYTWLSYLLAFICAVETLNPSWCLSLYINCLSFFLWKFSLWECHLSKGLDNKKGWASSREDVRRGCIHFLEPL